MNIVEKRISEIIPYKNNPRSNDGAVDYVANSIKEFGFKVPIVIDKDNVVVAGHTRLKASKKLGLKSVPCIVADDLSEDQIKAFRLADNKTAEKAGWDFATLDIELEGIDLDMELFGFDVGDFGVETVEEDDFEESIPEEPTTKKGDLWKLGSHRLLCGDSTDANDVSILMDGERSVLFTSPPYADLRQYDGESDMTVEHIAQFIPAFKPFAEYQCVNLGLKREQQEIVQYWDEYIAVAKDAGYKLLAWNVWDKQETGSIGMQKAMFPIRHEWIFVFGEEPKSINETWEKKAQCIGTGRTTTLRRQPDGTTKRSTTGKDTNKLKRMESVVTVHPEKGKIRAEHPATFPIELPAEYIKAMTQKGDVVSEPFCGSGSTLMACEQLERKCYGMEIAPEYCDVTIKRWEQYTGKKAELIGNIYGEDRKTTS